MVSNLTIGLLMGLGFAGWVYSKMYRSTGGNTKNALVVAVVAGLVCLLVVSTLLGKFLK